MMRVVARLFILTLLTAGALARAEGPPTPINLEDKAAVAQLEAELASDDFAVRDQAQRKLGGVGLTQTEALRALAQAATDPEVQARIAARVKELEIQRLIWQPNLSVHWKDATLADIAATLSKATGAEIPLGPGSQGADLFTLNAEDLPFWEIEKRLCAQHPIWFSPGSPNRLARDTFGWREQQVSGSIVVCIEDLRRLVGAAAGAAAPANAAVRYSCGMGVGVDPRMHVVEISAPAVEPITDDQGNVWLPVMAQRTPTKNAGPQYFWTRGMTLQAPNPAGKKLRAIRGSITLEIPVPGGAETRAVVVPFEFKDLPVPP